MKLKSLLISASPLRNALLGGALLLLSGCGESSPKLTATDSKTFDGAPAEVKQAWDKALVAEKANDYTTAQKLLESLRQMTLNDDQKQTLEKERTVFGAKLWAAAEKNDPAAVQAIKETQGSGRRNTNAPAR